ncbi:MAG: hypothetical protein ACFFAS_11330 [Promethearchaeota archaeon]
MINRITKHILDKVPRACEYCESERISFWEEKDGKFIFRCIDCGIFYPIPIDISINIRE